MSRCNISKVEHHSPSLFNSDNGAINAKTQINSRTFLTSNLPAGLLSKMAIKICPSLFRCVYHCSGSVHYHLLPGLQQQPDPPCFHAYAVKTISKWAARAVLKKHKSDHVTLPFLQLLVSMATEVQHEVTLASLLSVIFHCSFPTHGTQATPASFLFFEHTNLSPSILLASFVF